MSAAVSVVFYVLSIVVVPLALFAIIRAAVASGVRRGLDSFLQEASRETPARTDYVIPRRIDTLAIHLATIIRRPPEE